MMNVKILKSNDSDSSVARTVSNTLLDNYKRGLAIANQEVAQESGIASSVGVVDPSQTVRMKMQKDSSATAPVSTKGYKVKSVNATDVPNTATNSASQQAKEFIVQSKVLDNELDHVVALMKFDNKEDFYKQATQGPMDQESYAELLEVLRTGDPWSGLDQSEKDKTQQLQHYEKLNDESQDNTAYLAEIEELQDELQEIQQEKERLESLLPSREEALAYMVDQEDTIMERSRNQGRGKHSDFTQMKKKEFDDMISKKNSNRKSKRGIRMLDSIPVNMFPAELLFAVKKLSNTITSEVMPLAQKLYDKRFQGITLQDKNTVIPDLYQDMDEKMYMLTSLNNQSNAQLIKLDKEFDKLYNLVKSGLEMYVMPTGGAMVGGHIRNATNYLYEL